MKAIKSIFTILIAVMAISLSGCDSDDPITVPGPGDANYIELPRCDGFPTLKADGDWTVSEYPDWAKPMEETGSADTAISLYVSMNPGDEDRTGTIRVHLADGRDVLYTIFQHGALSDDTNADNELNEDNLIATYGVGFGLDVFQSSGLKKYSVKAYSPFDFKRLKTALEKHGLAEAMANENRYYSRIEMLSGSSTTSLANQLSVNAGIEVGISGFKLDVEGGFEKDSNKKKSYEYAIEEVQHIVGSRLIRPGALKYLTEQGDDIFNDYFNELVADLIDNPGDVSTMDELIDFYGTHIITQGSLGGELKLSMQMEITDKTTSSDIHAALELGSKIADVNAEFDMKGKNAQIAKNTHIKFASYGGQNVYTLSPGTTFETFISEVHKPQNVSAWVSDIKNGKSMALVDVELMPIYELIADEEARNALREYIVGPYQTKCYSTKNEPYPGPDLYVLSGFNVSGNSAKEVSVTIPEIDTEIVAHRELIKGLSATEYSTVIYSGNIGSVDRRRGFFIGSSTRPPCKFKVTADGKIDTEEFTDLGNKEIEELYIDHTGQITLAPKSISDMYRTVSFPGWSEWADYVDGYAVINLSTIKNAKITISSPTMLYGDTRESPVGDRDQAPIITLKNNATVCLAGATIVGGQIKCEGSATMILQANTTNVIDGSWISDLDLEDYPVIQIGPKGSAFKIEGTGSLNVIGNACGIGTTHTDGGNIIIRDGNITVRGQGGCAIGSNNYSSVGNISIDGGTVKAMSTCGTGLNRSPAIGAAGHGKCGSIFISRNIKSLTALTTGGLNAIGKGTENATVESVTIQDPSKVTQNNQWDLRE